MLDVVGTALSRDDARRAHPNTGGVILFARHFQNRAHDALTDSIRAVREHPDRRRSRRRRVQRFRTDGFTVLPRCAAWASRDRDVLLATKVATAR